MAAAAAELSFFKVLSSLSPFEHRIASLALFSNCDLLIVIGTERGKRGGSRFLHAARSRGSIGNSLNLFLPDYSNLANKWFYRVCHD